MANLTLDAQLQRSFTLMKLLINYELSLVAVDVEETSCGSKHLQVAHQLLHENFERDLSVVLFHLSVLNALGLLRSSLGEYDEALSALVSAESLYHEWRRTLNQEPDFLTLGLRDAFLLPGSQGTRSSKEFQSETQVEKEYTKTVYYVAQVQEKRGESAVAAKYCSLTLTRQLDSGDYDPLDWSLNAAVLSQYFANHDAFEAARRLLALALSQLAKVEPRDDDELLAKRRGDVDRILFKYCLMLMDREEEEVQPLKEAPVLPAFSDAEADRLEQEIPVSRPSDYDSALKVFLFANKRLASALELFTLDEHASDHADCILDQSRAYQLLLRFTSDDSRICKLQKRRVDLLHQLLSQLNPTYFQSHVRRMLFEVAEAYTDMVQRKTSAGDASAKPSVAGKINALVAKAIQHYERFVDSFRDAKTGQLPSRFEEEYARPLLVAWFAVGRLHTKRVPSSAAEQSRGWTECESNWRRMLEYVEREADHAALVQQECQVAQEMLSLMHARGVVGR